MYLYHISSLSAGYDNMAIRNHYFFLGHRHPFTLSEPAHILRGPGPCTFNYTRVSGRISDVRSAIILLRSSRLDPHLNPVICHLGNRPTWWDLAIQSTIHAWITDPIHQPIRGHLFAIFTDSAIRQRGNVSIGLFVIELDLTALA